MLSRLFILAVCVPALTLFCAGCAALKPDHLRFGAEHDERETQGPRSQRTVTNKLSAEAIYDLKK